MKIDVQQDLAREFDLLFESVERNGPVEGVFRIRALLEICDALSTTALVQLASVVVESEERQPSGRKFSLRAPH